MTTENFVRALRSFNERRPFRPFLIEFMTGDHLFVKHPELIFTHGELFGYMDPKRRYRIFDSGSVCQLMDPPED